MRGRRTAVCAALAVTLFARETLAEDDVVHTLTPMTCTTDGGTDLRLPPSYVLPEKKWDALDLELKTRGDRLTRAEAENVELRKSAGFSPGWLFVVLAAGAGFVTGLYLK